MNKTLTINLGGFIFHIDEDAYHQLENYLGQIKRQFATTQGGSEIIADIESRLAELFKERTSDAKEVITLSDIEEVINIMGKPEDYLYDDSDEPGDFAYTSQPYSGAKRIFRDGDNRIIGGVSSGVAAYFNIDALWIRLLFVVLFFSGPGIFIYLVMWLIIPMAKTTAEKLQMRGKSVNVSTIEQTIREEMQEVGENAKRFGEKARNFNYQRGGSQLGDFFSDLGNFLRDAFRLIFKFLFKLIGIIFLIFGFILLLAIITSIFAGGITLIHSTYSLAELMQLLRITAVNELHYNLIIGGAILSVIAPLFLLIYFGIRILFNIDPLNKGTRAALAFTTFIGLLLLIGSVARFGLEFDHEADTQVEQDLGERQHFYMTYTNDSISEAFIKGNDDFWKPLSDGNNAFDWVYIDVRKSNTDKAYIEISKEAHGRNNRDAKNTARSIQYQVEQRDSILYLPLYFILGPKETLRAQKVEIILYLPEGSSVYIDDRITPYLDDVKNLQNEWDLNMGNQRWIMTERGLSCEECEIPAPGSWEEDLPEAAPDTVKVPADSVESELVQYLPYPAYPSGRPLSTGDTVGCGVSNPQLSFYI